jgi:mannose-6-phosphate isomerase-like protein (cupin superfamily)
MAVSLAAATAGCSAITGTSEGEGPDPTEETFQCFSVDETGTLGGIADGNEPPEDAAEWQVVTNTLTEADWQEKESNDVRVARDYLAGELDRLPQHPGHERTVEQLRTDAFSLGVMRFEPGDDSVHAHAEAEVYHADAGVGKIEVDGETTPVGGGATCGVRRATEALTRPGHR